MSKKPEEKKRWTSVQRREKALKAGKKKEKFRLDIWAKKHRELKDALKKARKTKEANRKMMQERAGKKPAAAAAEAKA